MIERILNDIPGWLLLLASLAYVVNPAVGIWLSFKMGEENEDDR